MEERVENQVITRETGVNPAAMIVPPDFIPHWLPDLSNEAYHADKTSVSSTGVRKILRSPRRFKRDVLEGKAPPPSPQMNLGTLVHAALLEGETFLGRYAVMPKFEGHPNSNDYKARKADWLQENANKIIVTQAERDDVRGMVESVLEHPDAVALLKGGKAELSGFWRDPETGICCRLRPDVLQPEMTAIIDLKTTRDAEASEFSRSIWNFRYDIQMAAYGVGAEAILGRPIDFHVFICVESTAPYDCAVYTATPAMIARGRRDFHRGLRRLQECIKTNNWPGLQTALQNIDLPAWTPPEELS